MLSTQTGEKSSRSGSSDRHFRHRLASDVHSPGFYLHLQPGQSFVGVGIWHPDSPTLTKIRDAIVDDPGAWQRASRGKPFRERYELAGDSLKRAPRGYDAGHPLVEDLKRKDFVAVSALSEHEVLADDFVDAFAARCRAGSPLVRYLCGAVGVPF